MARLQLKIITENLLSGRRRNEALVCGVDFQCRVLLKPVENCIGSVPTLVAR